MLISDTVLTQMDSVFISYRREDSAYALLVYNRLIEEFGPEQVFRDIERIARGEKFAARHCLAVEDLLIDRRLTVRCSSVA